MFKSSNCVRSLLALTLVAGSSLATPTRLFADDCPSDLENTSEYATLASGQTTSKQKGVEEWGIEIIRFRLEEPGFVEIIGSGDESQGALFTNVEGDPAFVDSAALGASLDGLQTIVPAGDYCVQVQPAANSEGDIEVEVAFTDACDLITADDHGESFQCATPIAIDGSDSGVIASGGSADVDVFGFVLASPATVTLASSGSTNVNGALFSNLGGPLATDDDSGTGDNFQIVQYLTAGTYYLKVQGSDGSYGVSVTD